MDAGEAIFRKALEEEVDFLIVHHGLFWGKPFPIVGHHKRRLETLFQGGINLYAAHLPLDAHEEVGNNFVLARELGLVDLTPWDVGVKGRFPQPTPSCRWPTAWASSPGCSLWCTKEAWTTWRR